MKDETRRRLLTAAAGAGAIATAGCLDTTDESTDQSDSSGGAADNTGSTGQNDAESSPSETGALQVDLGVPCGDTEGEIALSGGRPPTELNGVTGESTAAYDDGELPLRTESLHVGHSLSTFSAGDISGGVSHDGIPSIDEPSFLRAGSVSLPPCERIIGVEIDGDVRAYPQRVLVSHEIVNDVVGGEPVAVTYCPLTGTAQGFYRGGTEFGVSGQLVNSNLIMWDHERDVRWPQIGATATEVGDQRDAGPDAKTLVGESLQEFDVTWTTWGRWERRHPDTLVMSTDTGRAANYNRDPYGSYTPVSGHYAVGEPRAPSFPLLVEDGVEQAKRVVIGARTPDGAVAFDKRRLLENSVLTGFSGDTRLVAVADDGLATGHIYRAPKETTVQAVDDGYQVDGETASPGQLPLESVVSIDAMWFSWLGFYPETTVIGLEL
jgi:hypothetical protein